MSRDRFAFDPPIIHLYNRANPDNPARAFFARGGGMAQFEAHLADLIPAHHGKLYAYSLLPNHWHLVIQLPTVTHMVRLTRELLAAHAGLMRRSRRVTRMPLYEGLCKSSWIRNEASFYRASQYVERNPVHHGYVPAPEEWRYSSAWIRRFAPGSYRGRLLAPWPHGLPERWADDA